MYLDLSPPQECVFMFDCFIFSKYACTRKQYTHRMHYRFNICLIFVWSGKPTGNAEWIPIWKYIQHQREIFPLSKSESNGMEFHTKLKPNNNNNKYVEQKQNRVLFSLNSLVIFVKCLWECVHLIRTSLMVMALQCHEIRLEAILRTLFMTPVEKWPKYIPIHVVRIECCQEKKTARQCLEEWGRINPTRVKEFMRIFFRYIPNHDMILYWTRFLINMK